MRFHRLWRPCGPRAELRPHGAAFDRPSGTSTASARPRGSEYRGPGDRGEEVHHADLRPGTSCRWLSARPARCTVQWWHDATRSRQAPAVGHAHSRRDITGSDGARDGPGPDNHWRRRAKPTWHRWPHVPRKSHSLISTVRSSSWLVMHRAQMASRTGTLLPAQSATCAGGWAAGSKSAGQSDNQTRAPISHLNASSNEGKSLLAHRRERTAYRSTPL